MTQIPTKNWWLLAIAGLLDGVISIIYFNHAGHGFHAMRDVFLLGRITIAAGVCTIMAGVWRGDRRQWWAVALSGVALSMLGLLLDGFFGLKIRFRTVAFLIIVTAVSTGIFQLAAARGLWRRKIVNASLLGAAGIGSAVFAFAFYVLGFGWVKIQPGSFKDVIWLGLYFAFCAVSMLGSALRLEGARAVVDSSPTAGDRSPSRPIDLRKRATSVLVSVR
jgi:uncharacterized membrane protein HdeD (DUF308 family)